MKLEDLSNRNLVDEFEYAVRENHYDPLCNMTPTYNLSDLREEIVRRLCNVPKDEALECPACEAKAAAGYNTKCKDCEF